MQDPLEMLRQQAAQQYQQQQLSIEDLNDDPTRQAVQEEYERKKKAIERLFQEASKSRGDLLGELKSQYQGNTKNPVLKALKGLGWMTGGGYEAQQRADKRYDENQENYQRLAKDETAAMLKMRSLLEQSAKNRSTSTNAAMRNMGIQDLGEKRLSADTAYRNRFLDQRQQQIDLDKEKWDKRNPFKDMQRADMFAAMQMNPEEAKKVLSGAYGLEAQKAYLRAMSQQGSQTVMSPRTSQRLVQSVGPNNNILTESIPVTSTAPFNQRTPAPITQPGMFEQILRGGGLVSPEQVQQSIQNPSQGLPPAASPAASPRTGLGAPMTPRTTPPATPVSNSSMNVSPQRRAAENLVKASQAANPEDAKLIARGRRFVIEPKTLPSSVIHQSAGKKDSGSNEKAIIEGEVKGLATQLANLMSQSYVKGIAQKAHGVGNNKLSTLYNLKSLAGGLFQNTVGSLFGQSSGPSTDNKNASVQLRKMFGLSDDPNDKEVQNYVSTFVELANKLGFTEVKEQTGLAALASERAGLEETVAALRNNPDVELMTVLAHAIRLNTKNYLVKVKGYSPEEANEFITYSSPGPGGNKITDPIFMKVGEIYDRIRSMQSDYSSGKSKDINAISNLDLDPEEIFGQMAVARGLTPENSPIKFRVLGQPRNKVELDEEYNRLRKRLQQRRGGR